MAWTLLAAGFCEKIANNTTKVALVAMFVFFFAIFYSVGEGPVPFTYSAEVFPLSHREVGMGFSVATNLFWAAILGLTFPSMLHAMGPTGAFGFYAALNVVAFIMIFLFMPETRQKTLEKLDDTFEVSAMDFARWQLKENIPHIMRRIMHRGSPDVRKQLYKDDLVDFRRQSL
jgi:MFS family permease